MAQAPILSPVKMGSAKRRRCSAVPRLRMAPPASPSEAPNASVKPGHTRASSIETIAIRAGSRTAGAASEAAVCASAARAISSMPKVRMSLRMVS